MARIAATKELPGKRVHVVESDDGRTLGWIHEGRYIWVDYVGGGLVFDAPKFQTVQEALASF